MPTPDQVRSVADLVEVCGGHRRGRHASEHVDPLAFAADVLTPTRTPEPRHVEACADLLQAVEPGMGRRRAENYARRELATYQPAPTPAHVTGRARHGRWAVAALALEAS